MKQRIELTESAIRKIIRDILLEEAAQSAWSPDPDKTYYWNDVPEVNARIATMQPGDGQDLYAQGATKYRYAYTPGTDEIKLILPVEKVVTPGTRAYVAIKAQFDANPDHISLSNDPMWFADKPVLQPALANRMSKKAILLIHGIFDSLEAFLDKGLEGEFGEKIQKNLMFAYPGGEAKVGSFDEKAIEKMKGGLDFSGTELLNVVKPPLLPQNPKRFANLAELIPELSLKVADSANSEQSISPEQIARSVSLKPDETVTSAANFAATEINAALKALHDLYSPQTTNFAQLGFGGQAPGDLERTESRRVFDRVGAALRAV